MSTGDKRAETTFLVSVTRRELSAPARYGRLGNAVIKVRGWKCRDVPSLMSEFGAALQFFDGFGEN